MSPPRPTETRGPRGRHPHGHPATGLALEEGQVEGLEDDARYPGVAPDPVGSEVDLVGVRVRRQPPRTQGRETPRAAAAGPDAPTAPAPRRRPAWGRVGCAGGVSSARGRPRGGGGGGGLRQGAVVPEPPGPARPRAPPAGGGPADLPPSGPGARTPDVTVLRVVAVSAEVVLPAGAPSAPPTPPLADALTPAPASPGPRHPILSSPTPGSSAPGSPARVPPAPAPHRPRRSRSPHSVLPTPVLTGVDSTRPRTLSSGGTDGGPPSLKPPLGRWGQPRYRRTRLWPLGRVATGGREAGGERSGTRRRRRSTSCRYSG